MNRVAKSGEEYFISPEDAIVQVGNRIYTLIANTPVIVECNHVEKIQKILKGDADAAVDEATGDSAPSDTNPRQYRRKSSEA